MDKTIISSLEQFRSFDQASFFHDVQVGLGLALQDMFSGLVGTTLVGGLAATQTAPASLTFNLAAGRIYQQAPNDAVAVGAIPQDLTVQTQQGLNSGQAITLIAPTAGQSQWNVIQGQFQQSDEVRAADPNSGNVPFYNASNPTVPNIVSVNTVRRGKFIVQVIQGAAATTGSEVPPTPTTGWTPLYMVDLAGGQGTVQTAQILKCGPSVGVGVPANYQTAPFLRGFLLGHHGGVPGQAPKIDLANETAGILPYARMSPVRTLLTANLALFVSPTGNDANPGTPGAPFATIQAAVNAVLHNYDFNGFTPTINVANGTYTGQTIISGLPLGAPTINLIGNTASPGSCVINVPSGTCVTAVSGASLTILGFTLISPGSGSGGSAAFGTGLLSSLSSISFGAMVFGACTNYHVAASNGGNITAISAYTVAGSAAAHLITDANGVINVSGGVITLSGTPAFSGAFALAQRASVLQAIGTTFIGSATGVRASATLNAVIYTAGGGATYFPGNAANSTGTGGQYA